MEGNLFRSGMQRLSGAVSIVVICGGDGERRGITVTSVCSLSAAPPSLIVCINQKTWVGQLAQEGCAFTVNVLAFAHRDVAEAFAGRSDLKGSDRFQVGHWIDRPSSAPMLADALVCFDCRLNQTVSFGTHLILIGAVRETIVGPGEALPLVYGEGDFATTTRRVAAAGDNVSQPGHVTTQTG